MTLAELTDFVCKKVGQIDSYSMGLCSGFINARYRMIWDSENWIDTLEARTVSTVIDDVSIDLPAEIDRAIVVQIVGGKVLEHVDIQFILETQPQLLSGTPESGTPIYYREFSNPAGLNQLQLLPPPDAIMQIYIYGKLAFVELGDADSPLIRNIDNCLIAYATADMLQRARQYAKAKECIEEAAALLEQMRKTEKERSNLPRRSKNITVTGDTLAEMVDAVCCRVGDYSAGSQIMVREFIRRNYMDVYDSQLWPESTVIARITRDGSETILPEYFDRVISIRQNVNLGELVPTEQSVYFGLAPQIFENSGSPVAYSILTPVGVTTLPPTNEQLAFVSSETVDVSNVFIRGETAGVEVSEILALSGTTPVLTENTYDVPLIIGKALTTGFIEVTGRTSSTFLVRILAEERERKHVRVWLLPTPTTQDGVECLALGKRRIKPLIADEDAPILRGISNILISLTVADYFTKMGNDKGADAAQKKAGTALQTLLDREARQAAFSARVVPYNDGSAFGDDCYSNAFCVSWM